MHEPEMFSYVRPLDPLDLVVALSTVDRSEHVNVWDGLKAPQLR